MGLLLVGVAMARPVLSSLLLGFHLFIEVLHASGLEPGPWAHDSIRARPVAQLDGIVEQLLLGKPEECSMFQSQKMKGLFFYPQSSHRLWYKDA